MMLRLLCAIAIAALASAVPHATQAATPPAEAMRMDHISVHTIGGGPPVILIPGLATPSAVWDGVAPELAKTRQVHLVQINGFGGEDPGVNLKPGLLAGAVADLDRYIAANDLRGAAVVGHSLGGLVGLMLAKAHPADVGRLMLVDSLPYIGDTFLPGATVAQVEPQAARIRDMTAASHGTPMDQAVAERTAAGMAITPAARARIAGWVKAADPRVSALALYEDMTTDMRPDMASIRVPITLVYPWRTPDLPRERADAFYRAALGEPPHATLVGIGESGHFVMLDQPAAFAAALREFLSR